MQANNQVSGSSRQSVKATQEIWEYLQEKMPEGKRQVVNFASLNRSWGLHVLRLKDAGFISINFRLEIRINEESRGEVYGEDAGCDEEHPDFFMGLQMIPYVIKINP